MKRFEKTKAHPLLQAAIVASTVAVFALDLATPLGIGTWILFLVPVGLSLYEWRPRVPLVIAAAATAFLVAGYFLSPQPNALFVHVARTNRLLGAMTIWSLALVVRQFILGKLSLRERDWVRSGQRELSTRVQGEHTTAELGNDILRFLCEYVNAPVGVIYFADGEGGFRRRAGYAIAGAELGAPERVTAGATLLGQAIKDRRIVRLDDLPPAYLPISSTLGSTSPAHVVMVPTVVDGVVQGAVELGFRQPVGRSDMDLLETVAETIAIAIRSAGSRARQAVLLEETQRQAEALQVQQEELRATNEELEEQSRALKESQAQLEAQHAELEQSNHDLGEQASILEQQRDELSRAQAELLEKAEALERTNQYKSEFLANMSHELRTPLNSALILAKLLADNPEGNLTAEQVKFASTIYSSGNDLLVLINDILDLSRIEAGHVEIHPEEVTMASLLESLGKTFAATAAQKGLDLALVVEPGAPASLTTDRLRLQQILRNLLSNALKFTERGGVSLRVSAGEAGRVSFSVQDSGIGIAADQHEAIFEAFRQADGSTHRRYGGTGLGLTISRQLARRMGGTLRVASEPGKGSTFTLALPTAIDGAAASEAAPAAAGPRQGTVAAPAPRSAGPSQADARATAPAAVEDDRASLRRGDRAILVIEDDARFASVLRDLARELRFRCLVASNAAQGLRLAEEFVPAAILLDVHLPDLSGLGVLERLKRNPETRPIPVHVVSVADYTQQALEMGAVGYALKPVKREEIVGAIRKLEERFTQTLRRLLIVEDVAQQRQSIEALVRHDGVEIISVGRGEDGLKLLSEQSFDCVVLDLVLPDMSGFDLLERLAAREAFSFPPVIVYTGRALGRDEELRLRRYASSIIVKGARSPERLLDEVSLFLHYVEAKLPPEQQRLLQVARQRDAALEDRTILVVEDDARNIFALSSILEPRGSKLVIARNGREALDLLDAVGARSNETIDLVLMDVMMPVMDGLTAIREIRRRPEWKKLPIIALTAKAMADDRQKCIDAGASDYIAKPLDVEKLLSLVKVWLPK